MGSLNEELEAIGVHGGIDRIAASAGLRVESNQSSVQSNKPVNALAETLESLYSDIRSATPNDLIDGDVATFERDLRASIESRFAEETKDGKATIEEAFKIIRKLAGGALRRAKIRKLTGGEKLAGKMARRRSRGKIKLTGKRYRRKASVKRREKRRRGLLSRNESVAASKIMNLLSESDAGASSASGENALVIEAYERMSAISGLLADFFEEVGKPEDAPVMEALDALSANLDTRSALIAEGKVDLNKELDTVTRFSAALGEALSVFEEYDLDAVFGEDEGND